MTGYFTSIWRCRYFWLSLVKMDLRTRYRRSVLGLGWSLLHPIAMTAILCTIFCRVFDMPPREYAPFLLAGLAYWNFLTFTVTQGCQCFFQGESYIRQYPSPLAIYPLRTTLGAIIHLSLAMGVVLLLSWILNGFSNVPAFLCLLPTMLLLFAFGWSLAVLAGLTNAHFQDTQHLCEIGFQILFYATPVMYKPAMLRDRSLTWLLQYNPFVSFLDLIRIPLLDGQVPPAATWLTALLTVAVTSTAAGLTMGRLQRKLIFHL
jgi:lipopolysaccharide transport system permease protein